MTDPPNNLRTLREAAHLTRDEVAAHINNTETKTGNGGVTDNTVYRWECGKFIPGIRRQRILADLYRVTVDALGINPPTRQPTPLAFLTTEPPINTHDPRVIHSREQWITTRRALNTSRVALAHTAADVYPAPWRLEDTALLTQPGWIPQQPVDLRNITLEHAIAPLPAIDGTEPETVHVRPMCTLTQHYPRYTHAIRDLEQPRLFESRLSWRLTDLEWVDGRGRMRMGETTYFAAVDINEAAAHELALVHPNPTSRTPAMRDLRWRRHIGNPFNLNRRPVLPSISTLTIRGGTDPTFLLHRRDSQSVAIAGGMLHVIPSGIFQPSSVLPAAKDADFDLTRNIWRELSEELFGNPEHNGDGQPIDYTAEPFATLDAARQAGLIGIHCLGVGLDALTLFAEVLTVAVLDPDVYDTLAADFVDVNDEGTVVAERLPFTADTIDQIMRSGKMAPAGAGCLRLAWQHRDVLLRGLVPV